MRKRALSINTELLFLELLYEQLDVGETLYQGLIESCKRLPRKPNTVALRLLGTLLGQAQRNGLSYQEMLERAMIHVGEGRLHELIDMLSRQYVHQGEVQDSLREIISHRLFDAYSEIERKVEQSPVKLLLPLFGCTLIGAWLFMGSAMLSVLGL